MKRYYAGIGSRETPEEVLKEMTHIASGMELKGFILRSGGAAGADTAFERGIWEKDNKEIFYAKPCPPWCYEMLEYCMPPDRPHYSKMQPYVQMLLARDMKQILGPTGMEPVEFVVCWTPESMGEYKGGTGYAARCARHNAIPVYNFYKPQQKVAFCRLWDFEELL